MSGMRIHMSMSDPSFGPVKTAEFPYVRFDSGPVIYEEALIEGQYLGAHWSAMGRPGSRQRVQDALAGRPETVLPNRQRQHAFQLQVDGQLLADRWQWLDGGEISCSRAGCREAVVRLRHELRPVEVEVHTRLDGSPVLTRWLVIHNRGDRAAAVAQADPWSGFLSHRIEDQNHPMLGREVFQVGRYQTTEWGSEGQFGFEPVPDGGLVMECRCGTSGYRPPFFIVRNQITGEAFIGALAHPGNWRLELLCDDTHKPIGGRQAALYFRFGPTGPAPLRVLDPGESATTPAVHLGHGFGDLDALVQGWHEHLRASVIPAQPADRRHLVECNHTGYTLNAQMKEEGSLAEVETAAAVGCELFLVDAGWFGDASGNWWPLVGDWTESELLPRGLQPVFDHARELGMLTGLWVEIERAAPTSAVGKAHPDWYLQRRGLPIHGLDLTLPEVARYVEDAIVQIVERYQLDVFRIDQNLYRGDSGQHVRDGFAETILWRYCDSLLAIFERVRRRFPKLMLENCSGGGGRNDLAMLSRFHWAQLSDNWSPAPALKILNGMTLCLAPEQCSTFMGAISYGVSDLDFQLRISLFNHPVVSGVFSSMAMKNDWALARWQHHLDLYKRFARPMLDTARVFHHTPLLRHDQPGDWCVLEYASPDGEKAYAGLWRLTGEGGDDYRFLPRGLSRERSYRVRFENSGHSTTLTGHELLDRGVRVRLAGPLTSELLMFEAA